MSDIQLTLTEGERRLLVNVLETTLSDTRVEARRTHYSPSFREQVLQEENLVRGLLEKLRQKP